MVTNGCITIYHYDEEICGYVIFHYKNASIYKGVRLTVKDTGFVNDGFLRIRIYTKKEMPISTRDYVFTGITNEPLDKNKCLKVVSYGDNRRGVTPHYRIECGQKYRR